ncbi:MAG: integrase arm-type DNA-binding domain-containing protein, partial [Aestuariivirgaceae bacterium]
MPRPLNKLNARQVATAGKPGRYSDGGGLYLVIDEKRRRWVFRYTRLGKTIDLDLGNTQDVSLAAARNAATNLRGALTAGLDPKSERMKMKVPSFRTFADEFIASMRAGWRNEKHAKQWEMTVTRYASALHDKPLSDITTEDVLAVLQPLWTRAPETAARLRGRIESILDAAKAKNYRTGENPARWKGNLKSLLPPRKRLARGHHTALPYDKLPAFMIQLRERISMAALALEFTILTAARSGETIGARWFEIDMDAAVWTVPKAWMKAGREHRVPLCNRALQILRAVMMTGDPNPSTFVFPGEKAGKPLSHVAMAKLLERMKVEATVHGFRSSFRDWASETTGFAHQTVEQALAHTIQNKAEAAYRRGDQLAKRREL